VTPLCCGIVPLAAAFAAFLPCNSLVEAAKELEAGFLPPLSTGDGGPMLGEIIVEAPRLELVAYELNFPLRATRDSSGLFAVQSHVAKRLASVNFFPLDAEPPFLERSLRRMSSGVSFEFHGAGMGSWYNSGSGGRSALGCAGGRSAGGGATSVTREYR